LQESSRAACWMSCASVDRTFSGLTKLIFPSGVMQKDDAHMLHRFALELRLKVRVQLHKMNPQEFPLTTLAFRDRETSFTETVSIKE
jgi:predicted ATP-dependent Lon-type protease